MAPESYSLAKQKADQSWRTTLIFLVPELTKSLESKAILIGRVKKIGNVMDERSDFDDLPPALKTRLLSFILAKGMQFIDEEMPTFYQRARSLKEHMREVLNVLEHKIASNKVRQRGGERPRFCDIRDTEHDITRNSFLPRDPQHTLGEIYCKHFLPNVRKKDCVLSRPTAKFEDRLKM